jgi:hypothetical protein
VKITLEMIRAARRVLGDDVPQDTIRAALEAAPSAAPAPKGARPPPVLLSWIVTTRVVGREEGRYPEGCRDDAQAEAATMSNPE